MSARLAVEDGAASTGDPGIRGEGPGSSFALRISFEGSAFVLVPEGHLDGGAGEVVAAAFAAAATEADDVVIDLRSVASTTSAGTTAIERCSKRGARLLS